jgi:membrane fusion protein (multidrug efflux system)
MRAEVTNRDGLLKPGQFVRVKLLGAVRNNALAVPQVAVMDGTQGKYVYVVDKDKDGKEIAAVRPITLGDWVTFENQNLWIVDGGLKPGDQVIVEGVAKLRPGAQIKAVAPGATAPAAPAKPAAAPAPKA